MSIEFKYLAPNMFSRDQTLKEYVQPYLDNIVVPDVQFQVDELPPGFPTRNFNLSKAPTTYILTANIKVEPTGIVFQNYQVPPGTHSMRNVQFEKDGLPASINMGGTLRRGKFFPQKS